MAENAIINKVEELSSFEGRSLRSANGESMYEKVHITEQDTDLLMQYLSVGVVLLNEKLHPFASVSEAGTITANAGYTIVAADKLAVEYLAYYIMSAWLSDKDAARSKFYNDEKEALAKDIRKRIFRTKPTY